MRNIVNFCDYFVLATGNSDRQVRGIALGIEAGLEELAVPVRYKQGLNQGHWALLDLGDVVAHIFDKDSRVFYGLDHLWQDAKVINWKK